MKNIYIVETTYGIHAYLEERKQAQMVHDAVEFYLRMKAKLGKFDLDNDNYILQDFANELEEYLERPWRMFVDDCPKCRTTLTKVDDTHAKCPKCEKETRDRL